MKYVTPIYGQRTAPREDNSSLYFASRRPQWLKEWIQNRVRFGRLVCGHFFDMNDRTGIIVGHKVDCADCKTGIDIDRPSTLMERFGITPGNYDKPPF